MKGIISILSLALFSMSAASSFAQPEPTHKDVLYGDDPEYQSFDAYLADTEKPAIALIEIHGGGWSGGEKSGPGLENSSGRVQDYLDAGISVFSINYRLSTVSRWPAL